ncbi:hypothetical protein SAMN05216337_10947 [Bradyrhizobium brasilense]|uniref:Uncharacterized protein n=1 Tax=Bradyrhizobium brasilense TaxID=1419277 RepID=A0A1G7QD38_9BRAD|nr:hypothetical protein SAMN05216337_10947 [Bradyrhizobium brasilense]
MKPIAGRPEAVPHVFHRNPHPAPGFVPGFRLSNERAFIVQDIVRRSLTPEHVSAVSSFAC